MLLVYVQIRLNLCALLLWLIKVLLTFIHVLQIWVHLFFMLRNTPLNESNIIGLFICQ